MAHGYLAADPDIRYFSDGTANTSFALGVTKKWKDKETQMIKEKTEWPRFFTTGKQAEIIAQYLKKGSELIITDSELRQRSYNNKDGLKVYVSEFFINMRGFEFCGKGVSNTAQQPHQSTSTANEPPQPQAYDDDLPF